MKKVKRIGFFYEHSSESGDPSREEVVKDVKYRDEEFEKILNYLDNRGKPYVVSPGIVKDIFDHSKIAGSRSQFTDGEWIWPDYLGYYLKNYKVSLSIEFINSILKSNLPR